MIDMEVIRRLNNYDMVIILRLPCLRLLWARQAAGVPPVWWPL